jgi:hypothetical protein
MSVNDVVRAFENSLKYKKGIASAPSQNLDFE